MNLDTVEVCIALIDSFTILALKCPLPEASQSMHHSNNNKMADKMAGGYFLASPWNFRLGIRSIYQITFKPHRLLSPVVHPSI
jgi:hypothetical protein